jgi:hypothetical protein
MSSFTPQALHEILCAQCSGAGLQLQPDGRVVCRFCGAADTLEGIICANCEWVNAPGASNCANCRQGLTRLCPDCSARNWSGADRCSNCGHPLDTLGYVMGTRVGGTPAQLERQRRDVSKIKETEEADSERRREYFEEIERRRQAALADAKRRSVKEHRMMTVILIAVLGLMVLMVGGLALVNLFR